MDKAKKQPKEVIPKRAQMILLIIGIPLLAFTSYRFAYNMGWIGAPPKAVRVAEKKPDEKPDQGGTARPTGGPAGTTQPTSPTPRPTQPVADLAGLSLPDGDPMEDIAPAQPAPGQPAGGGQAPGASPRPQNVPPPLPPPMPSPTGPGFPSPVPGEAGPLPPEMAPVGVRPVRRESVPTVLAAMYPLARRGGSPPKAPPVSLVGTISGSRGSIAVVHSSDNSGGPGRYVRPGQTVSPRTGHEVREIGSGSITVSSHGRTQQLALPRPGGAGPSGEAGAQSPVEEGAAAADSSPAGGPIQPATRPPEEVFSGPSN